MDVLQNFNIMVKVTPNFDNHSKYKQARNFMRENLKFHPPHLDCADMHVRLFFFIEIPEGNGNYKRRVGFTKNCTRSFVSILIPPYGEERQFIGVNSSLRARIPFVNHWRREF